MSLAAAVTTLPWWSLLIPLVSAAIALAGVLWTLWVNGDRAERHRQRELHARALEAVLAYFEMPFMIRRRRHESEQQSAERVRLATHISEVQTEMSTCEHLLAAEGREWLASEYTKLVSTARKIAGKEAHDAWKAKPITKDSEVNMPELFERLKPLKDAVDEFQHQISWADKTRRARGFRRDGPPLRPK